jgi:hypothetical protein
MHRLRQLGLGAGLLYAVTAGTVVHAQNSVQPPAAIKTESTIPRTVPFNGQVLTASGEPRTGTVLATFGLYTDQRDGAPLWTEQQLLTLDAQGRYSAILGSATIDGLPAEAFAAGTPRWLGVQVESDPEQPRFMLLSVPYALKAGDTDTVAGKPATELVFSSKLGESVKKAITESVKESALKDSTNPSTPTVTQNSLVKYATSGGAETESTVIDIGGKVGINVSAASIGTELDIFGAGTTTTLTLRNGAVASDVVKLVGSDGSLRIGSATTANMINLIGNNVGLRTTTPGFPLTFPDTLGDKISLWGQAGNHYGFGIQGGLLQIHSDASGADIAFGYGRSGAFNENVRFKGNGMVGIGINNPTRMLVVNGFANASAIRGLTDTGGEAVRGDCTTGGNLCYGIEGSVQAGNRAAYFYGGRGVTAYSADDSEPGIYGEGLGASAPGGRFQSQLYRSAHVLAPASSNGFVQLAVDGLGTSFYAERIFNGALNVEGNLVVGGSKSGYVVDAMQNVDTDQIEPGDVVVIVGSSAPVLGQIPVVSVRKASQAYDTAVAGVADQALYVPDAATKVTYEAEQQAVRAALAARQVAEVRARGTGEKPNYAGLEMPKITITDADGAMHATDEPATLSGGYVNVVTLGAFKMIKVDASFGAIHAGDLLTTSANPGYAMKVSDKVAAIGAIIGKALGTLETGTGTIPVLVMPK